MKNQIRIVLVLAAVAVIGDLALRQLPEKILANLEQSSVSPRATAALQASALRSQLAVAWTASR